VDRSGRTSGGVTDLWKFRELLDLARRDIKIRYKQAVMGFAWALFMHVLVVAGLIILGPLPRWGAPARAGAGELLAKGLCWSFFVGAIGFATPASPETSLVTKLYFPREVLLGTSARSCSLRHRGIAVLIATPRRGVSPAGWFGLLVLLIALRPGPASY
jgi:ABC-type polysaccharide/polyol phosphate export permease